MPTGAASARRKTLDRQRTVTSAAKPTSEGQIAAGFRPTSLKLPAELKAHIDAAASAAGLSPHAYMLKALSETTERARLREQFRIDALAARERMKDSGLGYKLGDVREYFDRLAQYRDGKARKPRKPALKKVA